LGDGGFRRFLVARVLIHAAVVVVVVALGGCASRGRASITSGASVVKTGTGTVEYNALHAGTVYVLDADTNRLVALAGVRKGQTVRADAAADRVMVGDKIVTESPMNDRHKYQIYFRGDPQRDDR
jgi:hypothetical protein